MKLHLNLFFKELVLFSLAFMSSYYISYSLHSQLGKGFAIEPLTFSWTSILSLVFFFAIFSFVITRHQNLAKWIFKIILLIIVLSGSQLLFATFLRSPWDLVASILLVLGFVAFDSIIVHDIAVAFGLAGIASLVGFSVTPNTTLAILIMLSIYDIVAVYKTRHMVKMAQTMIESGAVFGFIIPLRWVDFFGHREIMLKDNQAVILGSGDIGLPLIFISSIMQESVARAGIVAVFSVIGLFVTHLLFTNQPQRRAMAALPPIAMAVIVGYLVSLFLI